MEKNYKLKDGFTSDRRVSVPGEVVQQVRSAYDSGRYMDAYALAMAGAGPLQAWRGHEAQVIAARLSNNLGADRLSSLLLTRAHRERPQDAETRLHYGYHVLHRRGPMSAWSLAAKPESCENLTPELHADLIALRAAVAVLYRDFNVAESLLASALKLDPESAWLATEQARFLQAQEKRGEALCRLDEALQIRPWFRPAVQHRARLLHLLNRHADAVDYLTEALKHLQSGAVAMQLAVLKREIDDDAGMLDLLNLCEQWTPIPSLQHQEWLAACRSDAYYMRGDLAAAAGQAEKLGGEYYEALANRYRAATSSGPRVRLPVSFVLQGHRTCGPATLALIAQFWHHPATQEQIAQAICYDGTYDYSERQWCEENGFAAREFHVTWDSLRLLLNAGVPFALATVEVGSAHLQTVIGYDEIRKTLLIQDPGEPHYREVVAEEFLGRYKLTGPRGMAVVPADRRAWVNSLPLPDADFYDLNFAFNRALARHSRDEACSILERMTALDPLHRLTLFARLSLAGFDRNTQEHHQVLLDMLTQYPDDMRLLHWHVQSLRELGRPEERLRLLRRIITLEQAHPSFLRELAVELSEDYRHRHETRRLLWWAHRCSPVDSAVLSALAVWHWREPRRQKALDFFRFAAALSDKVEAWSVQWFNACVALNRSEEALAWLRQRNQAYGDQSSGPALTLAVCLERLCLTEESLAVVEEAVRRRPDDGELLVHASRLAARFGKMYEAQLRLQRARQKCSHGQWLRADAALAGREGDHARQLAIWREILQTEPLAMDAHQSMVALLELVQGTAAAGAHLQEACTRFPQHYELNQTYITWLREHAPEEARPPALAMLAHFPDDAWLHREIAHICQATGGFEEAMTHATAALNLAPRAPQSLATMAMVLQAMSRTAEAEEHCRKALQEDINFGTALIQLLECTNGSTQRDGALDFIRHEMIVQVLNGETLHIYRVLAYGLIEPRELMAHLREVWQARPDLWEAWSVLISQAQDAGELEEAARLAEEASRRFPLLPGAWRDLGQIMRLQGRNEESLRAYRRTTELNPDWDQAWQDLAQLQEDLGQAEDALHTVRTALKRMPRENNLRMLLAIFLWRAGERQEPWELVESCLRDDPTLQRAWGILSAWVPLLHRQQSLEDLARSVTREHPAQARLWMMLARILGPEAVEERLQAVDRALAIRPRLAEAYDFKAILLSEQGKFEEARKALWSGPWGTDRPAQLAGREAWLLVLEGKPQEGMIVLRKVLKKHRDFHWGWERLYELAEHVEQPLAMREAARELLRLSPRDPDACSRAALVELGAGGNEARAVQHLERALHLEPAHDFSARQLLDLYWRRKDLAGLEKASTLMLATGPTGWVRKAYSVLAHCHRRNLEGARAGLKELVECQDDIFDLLGLFDTTVLNDTRYKKALVEVMDAAVAADTIGPAFALLWIREQARQGKWQCWRHFGTWIPRMQQRAVPAIHQLIDLAADTSKAGAFLPELLREHRDFIHPNTELWAAAGRALATSNLELEAVNWMKGAETRPDIRGWMLAIYEIALNQLNRGPEATEVSLAAVRLGVRDDTWPLHVSQAGFGTALAGDHEQAQSLLKLVPPGDVPPQWRLLHTLGDALSKVMPLPPHEARAAYKVQINRLRGLAKSLPAPTPILAGQYTQAVEAMAGHAGVGLWSWQRKSPKPKRQTEGAGSSLASMGPFPIIAIVVLLFQVLRHCDPVRTGSSYAPMPSPEEQDRSARRLRELRQAVEQQKLQDRLLTPSPLPQVLPVIPPGLNGRDTAPPAPLPGTPVPVSPSQADFERWLDQKPHQRSDTLTPPPLPLVPSLQGD